MVITVAVMSASSTNGPFAPEQSNYIPQAYEWVVHATAPILSRRSLLDLHNGSTPFPRPYQWHSGGQDKGLVSLN